MIRQEYRKTRLSNGLTIVSENIPFFRSISLGIWVKTGTRFEDNSVNGVAHFLEHMMFKATARRNARDIVRSIESLGGMLNAFTSKEQTCYHVEILDEHLSQAMDVLADILLRSDFPEEEFSKERRVILDELQSLEDSPEELIQDYFTGKLFPDHSLGFPILGTTASVSALSLQDLMKFYCTHYRAENIVISAAGNVNHQDLIELTERSFDFSAGYQKPATSQPLNAGNGESIYRKHLQQSHLCIGAPGISYGHPQKYTMLVLNAILGMGMGSRLFQNIREKHGIAYEIFSFLDFFLDSGLFGVYLGTDVGNQDKAIELLDKELEALRISPAPEKEIEEAKSQLKGNIVLGLESSVSRMTRLAMMEIYFGKFISLNSIIEKIDQVTQEAVWETAKEIFHPDKLLRIIFTPIN